MKFLRDQKEKLVTFLGEPKPGPIRKITGIKDREGKTRVIAILDYWSQTALYPLHQWIFGILRKIPQDLTFCQGSFTEKVKE